MPSQLAVLCAQVRRVTPTRRAGLQRLGLAGPDSARDLKAQLAQLRAQGTPGDAEQVGGPGLVAAGVFQDAGQHEPVQLPVDLRVQVPRVRAKPLDSQKPDRVLGEALKVARLMR